MTSFNINQPGKMPQVTEAQNMMNNGGGGNTGYLETGRKKKKKKEEESFDPSILIEKGEDKFERSEIEYEDDDDYYNTSSIKPEVNELNEEPETKKEENLNPDNIKNKFLGLIGKIVKNNEEEQEKQNVLPSGDFLTISKNKDIDI